MEVDPRKIVIEENLNVYFNGRQPASWQAYLALASAELGTAQPQLVLLKIISQLPCPTEKTIT